MELKLTREADDKAPAPQQDKGQPVAILAQESPNATDYMDRDVSIEGIQNSRMWNVHDSPRKWVDDQGLPDGTTAEMVKNKTRRANEKREKRKRRDGRQMEREEMYEKGRPSCAGRFGGYIFEMNILRTAMDFFLPVWPGCCGLWPGLNAPWPLFLCSSACRGARMFAFLPLLTRPSAMPVERVADAGPC